MSDKAEPNNRLKALISPKGEAPRPTEQPTRAISAKAATAPTVSSSTLVPRTSLGVKSLTLRLTEEDYERLRLFAFEHRYTHQDVLAAALREFLDAHSS